MQDMQDATIIRREPAKTSVARIELDNGISFVIQKANLPVRIGRAADCDISIPSGLVSRHHCELYLVNGVLCLRDTSSNGTVIDERLISRGSVSIQGPTSVMFAGEVGITIIPVYLERRHSERRMGDERRQGDRRQNVVVVDFERRTSTVDRRTGERRT